MSKHTPGPWEAVHVPYEGHASARYYIYGKCKDNRFPTVAHIKHSTKQPMEANARLIAAAPDLLYALIALVNAESPEGSQHYGETESERDAYKLAFAAIAKATGEA